MSSQPNKSTIQVIYGNLLDFSQNAVLFHGVNCQGVMGSGVAKSIRDKYPEVFPAYERFCLNNDRSDTLLGCIDVCDITDDLFIINAFTQHRFGTAKRHVNYEAVVQCLEETNIVLHCLSEMSETTSTPLRLYFPKFGAGLTGGNWDIIKACVEATIDQKFQPTLVEFVSK